MGNWLFFNYNNWKVLLPMGIVIALTGMKFGITILDFFVLILIVIHYVFVYMIGEKPNFKPKDKTNRNSKSDEPIKIRR